MVLYRFDIGIYEDTRFNEAFYFHKLFTINFTYENKSDLHEIREAVFAEWLEANGEIMQ